MVKTSTGISIEDSLLNKFKEKYPRGSFSEFVEKLIRREFGSVITLEELEQKIIELNENLIYINDKKQELIKIKQMEFINKTQEERNHLQNRIEEKEIQIQETLNKLKDLQEIKVMVDEIRQDKNKINDTKVMIKYIDLLREKYPNLKVGVVQLRDALNRLI